jgi:hypothetical protein
MSPLRQRMIEDMQVRNLAAATQSTYLEHVYRFARHFHRSPEDLGPEEIRTYQLYLINERGLAPQSALIAVSALRFVYTVSLKRNWNIEEVIPAPKKPDRLPMILSQGGSGSVSRMCPPHPASRNPHDVLRGWSANLRSPPFETHSHRQPAHAHSCRAGQGSERSVRNALPETARHFTAILASCASGSVAL